MFDPARLGKVLRELGVSKANRQPVGVDGKTTDTSGAAVDRNDNRRT
jgi:hypothetical protein